MFNRRVVLHTNCTRNNIIQQRSIRDVTELGSEYYVIL